MRPRATRALLWASAVLALFSVVSLRAQEPPEQGGFPQNGIYDGSKAVIESGPCCGASHNAAVIRGPDLIALASAPGLASRDGGVLKLKLAGNRYLKLTDCDEQPACAGDDTRIHRFVAWWPKQRLYVIDVGLYEETAAFLVSERDGRILHLPAPPVLSPSGRQGVSLVSNLMQGVELAVVDFTSDPPRSTRITTMPDCGGAGPDSFLRPIPAWTNDTHVTFEGQSPLPDDKSNSKQLLRVEGGKGQWEC
jgi:hypothetical protein